jgi:nucleoside-diphosphate-sugar epimerase
VFGPRDRDFLTLFRLATHGIVLYPGTAQHWLSVLHVDDVVQGLIAASRSERAISRTYFLSSSEPVQWRTIGENIASAVGKPVRHVDLYGPLVQTASAAGEWLGRLTHTATIANRSKAELSRHPFWVCSGLRARQELAFQESRSLPDALRDTYYWYRQSGWLRGSRRIVSAVA